MEVGLGPGHIVLNGDPAPLHKKGAEHPPQFLAHVYCGETAGWIKMPLGAEVNLGPGDGVRWGRSSPLKRAQPPKFSVHVYCGQTAEWRRHLVLKERLGPNRVMVRFPTGHYWHCNLPVKKVSPGRCLCKWWKLNIFCKQTLANNLQFFVSFWFKWLISIVSDFSVLMLDGR